MNQVNWMALLSIPMWQPISKLTFQSKIIAPNIYALGKGAYVIVGPWSHGWQPAPKEERIIALKWVVSDDVAIHMHESPHARREETHGGRPPNELVVGGNPEFAALRAAIIRLEGRVMVEEEGLLGGGGQARLRRGNFSGSRAYGA